ncbi:MAG: lactonase family protein [Prevotellaceae bacterium]|jgi:6-phosphogluconolactonase|nr:lactonase family protein [Prevotellaceae bacterium]
MYRKNQLLLALTAATALLCTCSQPKPHNAYSLLVSGYTTDVSRQGMSAFVLEISPEQIALSPRWSDTIAVNPSFVALSPDKRFAYAVQECGAASAVIAFAVDSAQCTLSQLNTVPSDDACHVAVSERHVITASYASGTVSVYERLADGALGRLLQTLVDTGKSVVVGRQDSPHVHQTIFSPDGKFVYVNDLGTDEVSAYAYHANEDANVLQRQSTLRFAAGSGPRHSVVAAAGNMLYTLNEISATLCAVAADNSGQLSLQQTLPLASHAAPGGADLHLSPDGKFLYATNRDTANVIELFALNADGSLRSVESQLSGGKHPRNFAITRDGKYVLVANRDSHSITIFLRDAISGRLTNTGLNVDAEQMGVGAPTCVVEI